jgi:hypothetical protein
VPDGPPPPPNAPPLGSQRREEREVVFFFFSKIEREVVFKGEKSHLSLQEPTDTYMDPHVRHTRGNARAAHGLAGLGHH